jgi:hypothetical protein
MIYQHKKVILLKSENFSKLGAALRKTGKKDHLEFIIKLFYNDEKCIKLFT